MLHNYELNLPGNNTKQSKLIVNATDYYFLEKLLVQCYDIKLKNVAN